jgi:PPK2 family polyphosphate:nucleotide phosphotransferase
MTALPTLAHIVKPGSKIKLNDYNTLADAGFDKDQGEAMLAPLTQEIDELQELLYAADTHSLLVILQGMDTSGKDGTVRAVFRDVSPLGSHVTGFKVPTEEELAHDFLWRVHRAVPRRGQIAIFNRSHYEDVLVVRVNKLVPESMWQQRYEQINNFERLLAQSNTIILKFFLHISKEEQEERLIAREQDVTKAWKLSVGDWKERERWGDYMAAYSDALERCSTDHAPWRIVPADRKWYRNIAVAQAIIDELKPYQEQWLAKLAAVGAAAKTELAAYRAGPG